VTGRTENVTDLVLNDERVAKIKKMRTALAQQCTVHSKYNSIPQGSKTVLYWQHMLWPLSSVPTMSHYDLCSVVWIRILQPLR